MGSWRWYWSFSFRESIGPHGKKKFSSLEHCTRFTECLTIAKAIAVHISWKLQVGHVLYSLYVQLNFLTLIFWTYNNEHLNCLGVKAQKQLKIGHSAEREKTWRLEPAEQHPDHHHNPLVRDRSCHACNLCNTTSAYAAVKNLSQCFRVRRKETHFTNWCKDMPREKNGSCNLLM